MIYIRLIPVKFRFSSLPGNDKNKNSADTTIILVKLTAGSVAPINLHLKMYN